MAQTDAYIRLRSGTAAAWTSANPILLSGEKGIESDTLKEKVGDGATTWTSLGYQIGTAVPESAVFTDTTYSVENGGLTEINLTSALKTNYDDAYTHSQASHAPTNADNTAANETSHTDVLVDGDVGVDVQGYDAGLTSIAGLTTLADRMIYTTASDTYAVTPLTTAGRALLDDADASAQRTTLGLAIGTDVQAHDTILDNTTASFLTADETKLDGLPSTVDFNTVDFVEKIGSPTHISTLAEVFNHMYSAGVMDDCTMSDNGDGTVSFTSGSAMLRSSADSHSTLYAIEIDAQANLELVDGATNYIYLDYNGGSPIFVASSSETSFNCQDKCIAYLAVRDGNHIDFIDASQQNVDGNTKQRRLFMDFSRFIHKAGGSVISEVDTRNIDITAGAFYFMISKTEHPHFDTSIAGTANENIFSLAYRDGAGGWTEIIEEKRVTNTLYDDGSGTLATIANSKFGVTWFYIVNNTPSHLVAVYGQDEYASLADAENASPPATVPIDVGGLGALVGFVVYQENATNFDNTLSAFSQTFSPSAATTHNGLAGIEGGGIDDYQHLTTTELTKLGGIATGADVTSANETSHADVVVDGDIGSTVQAHSAVLDATTASFLTADETKLDGIEASANNYSHPTGDGNLHVPANSTTNDGKVLTAGASAGTYTWETSGGGLSDPMTTRGDLIFKNASNVTVRLPAGTVGQVLTSDGTDISWDDAAGGGGGIGEFKDSTIAISHNDTAFANDDETYNSNIGIGYSIMAAATTGAIKNVCIGVNLGTANTTGDNNVFIGEDIAVNNTGPNASIAIGDQAYYYGNGLNNIALGKWAMFGGAAGVSGGYNLAILPQAGYALTTGANNVNIGQLAGYTNATGSFNVFLGYNAGKLSTGGNSVHVGKDAGITLTTGANNMCLGYLADGSSATVSNEITLGNSSIATLRCQVTTITSLSDERDKANVQPLDAGLDFINTLNPVRFDWNTRDGAKVGDNDIGFIAQELQQAQVDKNIGIPHLVMDSNPDKLEAGYGMLIAPLVQAIKELTTIVDNQQLEINALKGL